jgi:hypothetical protein
MVQISTCKECIAQPVLDEVVDGDESTSAMQVVVSPPRGPKRSEQGTGEVLKDTCALPATVAMESGTEKRYGGNRRASKGQMYMCECGCETLYQRGDLQYCLGKCGKLLNVGCVERTWKCPTCSKQSPQLLHADSVDDVDYLHVLGDGDGDGDDDDDSDGDGDGDDSEVVENKQDEDKDGGTMQCEVDDSRRRPSRRTSLSAVYMCECGCAAVVTKLELVQCRGKLCMKLLRRSCCAPGCATYKCHSCASK